MTKRRASLIIILALCAHLIAYFYGYYKELIIWIIIFGLFISGVEILYFSVARNIIRKKPEKYKRGPYGFRMSLKLFPIRLLIILFFFTTGASSNLYKNYILSKNDLVEISGRVTDIEYGTNRFTDDIVSVTIEYTVIDKVYKTTRSVDQTKHQVSIEESWTLYYSESHPRFNKD